MHISLADVPAIAAQLDHQTLHVWQLDHDPRRGRAPLLGLLGAYLDRPAHTLELVEGEHGRPRLAHALAGDLDFNWSHSGERAMVVLGRGVSPGIDLERRRARPRALELARRYFDPSEADWLASLAPADREESFLSLWTAKEAVLKALGRGIAFGLHRLRIGLASGTPQLLSLHGDDARAWQLRSLAPDGPYVGALAWRGPARSIECRGLAEPA